MSALPDWLRVTVPIAIKARLLSDTAKGKGSRAKRRAGAIVARCCAEDRFPAQFDAMNRYSEGRGA